jgi:hypothetical protein
MNEVWHSGVLRKREFFVTGEDRIRVTQCRKVVIK